MRAARDSARASRYLDLDAIREANPGEMTVDEMVERIEADPNDQEAQEAVGKALSGLRAMFDEIRPTLYRRYREALNRQRREGQLHLVSCRGGHARQRTREARPNATRRARRARSPGRSSSEDDPERVAALRRFWSDALLEPDPVWREIKFDADLRVEAYLAGELS
jgi:hypothetical protein